MEVVAVLGASSDSNRYSYKAIELLQQYGHKPLAIHPRETEVLGLKVYPEIKNLIQEGIKVDTLTMYVNPALSTKFQQDILDLRPGRVIFNPGSENPQLEKALQEHGIKFEEACTLVMLRTGQF